MRHWAIGHEEEGGGIAAVGSAIFGTGPAHGAAKTSLAQQVYAVLMDSLDRGEMEAGGRIVALEVANRLGVSRAPVREALAVLAGQGLVELSPDRGARLRVMNRADLAAVCEVNALVAAVGLRAAAARVNDGDAAQRVGMAMECIRAARAVAPRHGFYLAINDYHHVMHAIGERPHVDFVFGALNVEYWNRLLARAIDLERHVDRYIADYARITDAVLAGDGASAEAIMRHHAGWCQALLVPERGPVAQ
ncbi:GntR family transcriptional regulator [Sphingomonas sp. CJ20]